MGTLQFSPAIRQISFTFHITLNIFIGVFRFFLISPPCGTQLEVVVAPRASVIAEVRDGCGVGEAERSSRGPMVENRDKREQVNG